MNFFNRYHLGDSVYSMIYLNNIENDNYISYNMKINYLSEINNINYKNIKLTTNNFSGVDLWIQSNMFWSKYTKNNKHKYRYYDEFYMEFYNDLSKRYNIKSTFNSLNDTLFYHPDLEKRRYENYDILIMNSVGMSGQYNYNHNDFIKFINKIKDNFKIITTEKIIGVDCTRDSNMSLLDLSNLSLGCNNIIGVHSSPYSTILNKKSIENVKQWIVLNTSNINYKIKNDFLSFNNINDVDINLIK